jgi:acyl carrier protein
MKMKTDEQVRAEIRNFVVENFLMGDATAMPGDRESFLENGTIDSTGVLEVVTFLEANFGLKVEDRELLPENIDSVNNQVKFVLRKLNAA